MTTLEPRYTFRYNLSKCRTTDNIATGLKVAVMTICGSLSSPINLLEILDYYMEIGCDTFDLSYVPNTKKSNNKNKAFYNCLTATFYYLDKDGVESKIAAKVFPNGSIQLPGCRTIEAVYNAPRILFNFIKFVNKECMGRVVKNPDTFKLRNVRIVMINSNFSFSHGIFQERFKDIINMHKFDGNIKNTENVWRIASFQPEKYSGINIRYMTKYCRMSASDTFLREKKLPSKLAGQVSIFIFRSGKATITGAKKTSELFEAYKAIVGIARKNFYKVFHIIPQVE